MSNGTDLSETDLDERIRRLEERVLPGKQPGPPVTAPTEGKAINPQSIGLTTPTESMATESLVDASSGNSYDVDTAALLAAAGFGPGDDFLFPVGTSEAKVASTSSTYGAYDIADVVVEVQWDTVIPSSGQGRVAFVGRLDPATDAINARIHNPVDVETAAEVTGITTTGRQVIGPVNYTPTTTAGPIQLRFEFSNQDNATSVECTSGTLYYGVGL